MREILLAALLAAASGPALAADPERLADRRVERAQARMEARAQAAQQSSASRSAEEQFPSAPVRRRSIVRSEPSVGMSAASPAAPAIERSVPTAWGPAAIERVERRLSRRGLGVGRSEAASPTAQVIERVETPGERAQRRVAGDTVRQWRARDRERSDSPTNIEQRNLRRAPGFAEQGGGLVRPERPLPRVFDPQQRRVSRTPVLGTEPPPPATASSTMAKPRHQWRSDWRHDRRYNWWEHRRKHRNLFRLGFYYDPFGWNYYRYGIGWRLWPHYYRSSYWLHDPWMYRLPPVYGPYRWIRYWDDALLVNIYTGQVVDVIHNFFW